jgi:hypothetical protein
MVGSKTFKPRCSLNIMHNSTVLIGTVAEKVQMGSENSQYATTPVPIALSTLASYGELSLVTLVTLKVEDRNFPTCRKQTVERRNGYLYLRTETSVGL